MKKSTDDLIQDLMTAADLSSYIKETNTCFYKNSIAELLESLYASKNISKAELARRSDMSEVYLHQLFSGRRKPSRDKMLCLCIGMGLSIDETQQLLKLASFAPLYPRIRREAIIYHCIVHSLQLDKTNESLYDENEHLLSSL